MKMKIKEYDNYYYFDFIDHKIKWLIDPSKINELNKDRLSKIKNKLSNEHLEILNKIEANLQLVLFAKLCHQMARKDEPYSEKEFNLRKCLEEAEDYLKTTINSMDKNIFLEFISELAYWFAKVETTDAINFHKKYLNSWSLEDHNIEIRNKHKRKGQQMKEKLKIIMGSKVEDYAEIKKARLDDADRFEKGKMNLFVNVDYEIDIEKADPNNNLILPTRWMGEKEDFRIIDEHTECVEIDGKKYTLKDYYLEIAQYQIDEDWIKSKDLLKQILTVYLIKRCQNGDKKAFDILYKIYFQKAEKVEELFIKSRSQNPEAPKLLGRGVSILASLLSGDNVEALYDLLDKNQKEKDGIDLINKKAFLALKQSYEEMFKVIVGQLNMLENKLNIFENSTKNLRNRYKTAKKEDTKKSYLLSVFSSSSNLIHSVDYTYTTFLLFEPKDFISISTQYNKYLYMPDKKSNLTTWLFGGENTKFKGMIWQTLGNIFDGRKVRSSLEYNDNIDYSQNLNSTPETESENF